MIFARSAGCSAEGRKEKCIARGSRAKICDVVFFRLWRDLGLAVIVPTDESVGYFLSPCRGWKDERRIALNC
jgi:hypothetical protein